MIRDIETIATTELNRVTGGASEADKLIKTTQNGRTVWVLPKSAIPAMNDIGPRDPRW
jgi:hypothetical protein